MPDHALAHVGQAQSAIKIRAFKYSRLENFTQRSGDCLKTISKTICHPQEFHHRSFQRQQISCNFHALLHSIIISGASHVTNQLNSRITGNNHEKPRRIITIKCRVPRNKTTRPSKTQDRAHKILNTLQKRQNFFEVLSSSKLSTIDILLVSTPKV